MTERITAAEKAIEVTKERNEQYGPSTAITALLWWSYLDTTVTDSDVELMMVYGNYVCRKMPYNMVNCIN